MLAKREDERVNPILTQTKGRRVFSSPLCLCQAACFIHSSNFGREKLSLDREPPLSLADIHAKTLEANIAALSGRRLNDCQMEGAAKHEAYLFINPDGA